MTEDNQCVILIGEGGKQSMSKKIKISSFIIFLVSFNSFYAFANDKVIIEKLTNIEERLIRLEEGQKALNTRIDDVNTRIDDVNTRIDDLRGVVNAVLGGMITLLCGMIALTGFVLWDRRTAISPVISKTKELEKREDIILKALKEYAFKEPKMAAVLRSLNLF